MPEANPILHTLLLRPGTVVRFERSTLGGRPYVSIRFWHHVVAEGKWVPDRRRGFALRADKFPAFLAAATAAGESLEGS